MTNKAIFLDRDGVLNTKRDDYVKTPDELEILSDVKALKLLQDNNFKLIIVTNQSMIGRNISTLDNLKLIHKKLLDELLSHNIYIDKIYFCPHTPNENCKCRKPKTQLFENAIFEFDLDVKNSWLIGDGDGDVLAGQTIGCNTIKVASNTGLSSAIEQILYTIKKKF